MDGGGVAGSEPSFARRRASGLQRLLLKAPPLVYHGPIADLLRSRCVMLLTTIGRRSGRPRTLGISFMPVDDHLVVFSGWGVSSNWYRNLRANPEVMVQVGRRRLRATAKLVEEPSRRIELMQKMQARSGRCGPPQPVRPVLKALHLFDYQAEIDTAVAAGGALPVIELFPHA
jgi:deazaflavin-dependent oxidoreductase (nitroreductase family)